MSFFKKSFSNKIIMFSITVILLMNGCASKTEKKPLTPNLKVAIAVADMQWDGMQIMREAIDKRSKKEQVEVAWLDAGNNSQEQKVQLEKLMKKTSQQQVKAVVLQPVDPLQSASLVKDLAKANIKVVALESLVPDAPLDGYITSDHIQAGQLQVRFALNSSGPRGIARILILKGMVRDTASQEIAAAIRGSVGPNIQVTEIECPGNNQDDAETKVRQVLTDKRIDAILATDSRLALGAAQALKAAGLKNGVVTAGVGAGKEAALALAVGEHNAEVDTMPELMGQYIYDAAVSLAKTGHWQNDTLVNNGNYILPAKIIPVRLIDKANVYLLEQRWGKEMKGKGGPQKVEGDGGSSSGDSESGGSGDSGGAGSEGGQAKEEEKTAKTKLRITTQDGKTVEVDIPGEVKKIESASEGQERGKGSGGQQGGSQ